MSVDVHEKHARIIPEEVIVESRYLNAMFKECGHDLIHLTFGEHQIAHNNVFAAIAFGHSKPAAEAEWRWDRIASNLHVQIIARNVHFQDVRLVVAPFADDL